MQDFVKNGNRALAFRLIMFSALFIVLSVIPIVAMVSTKATNAFSPLIYTIAIIALIISFTFTIIYAFIGHKIFAYKLNEKGLTIIRGFIFKKQSFMPNDKIKKVVIKKNLLFCDLCSVTFKNEAGDLHLSQVNYNFAVRHLQKIKG